MEKRIAMETKTLSIILHTSEGDVISSFDGSEYSKVELAMDLVRSYLEDGKKFSIKQS